MKHKKNFYSVPELADIMHMSRVGVFKKVKKGEIKAERVGKSYAIPASEAEQYIVMEDRPEYGRVRIIASDEGPVLDVVQKNGALWLSIDSLSEFFGRDKAVIFRNIENIIKEGELSRDKTAVKLPITGAEGRAVLVEHYSLDVLFHLGFRLKSASAADFRRWALRELKKSAGSGVTKSGPKRAYRA